MQTWTIVTLFVVTLVGIASSEKILFLLPFATKSHKNVYEPLIKALADRNHQVIVASPVGFPKPYPNVKEIIPVPYDVLFQVFPDPFEMRKLSKFSSAQFNVSMVTEGCEMTYKNPEFMALLEQKFDLIIWNFFNDCCAGLVHKLGAPFIILSTVAAPAITAELVGNRLPPSFVPMPMLSFTHEMTFWERTLNTLAGKGLDLFFKWNYPALEKIYRKYLGEDLPSIREIEGNVSMIFSNSYFPLTYPRPLLPDVIEVGGMHCRPPKALPKDLDDFLTGAEHGFIYFSMGSILKTDQMPDHVRQIFLNVFGRLKQRVIWKWNSGEMKEKLPSNVKLSQWLPQQDILGHPNIKMFMTHGGLLSTQEASYHGVPLLGIPMFADQDMNMLQANRRGYAVTLEILDITEELLESKIKTLLNDPTYANVAKEIKAVIKDQPTTPVNRAVFWAEYVIRHKGASHLRSAARQLNYIQYHSLDVVAFLGSVLISVVLAIFWGCKICVRKVCCRKGGSDKKKKE